MLGLVPVQSQSGSDVRQESLPLSPVKEGEKGTHLLLKDQVEAADGSGRLGLIDRSAPVGQFCHHTKWKCCGPGLQSLLRQHSSLLQWEFCLEQGLQSWANAFLLGVMAELVYWICRYVHQAQSPTSTCSHD